MNQLTEPEASATRFTTVYKKLAAAFFPLTMTIYLVPFLLDFLLFFVLLRLADASGREMHLSNTQATALLVAFSLGYMLLCPVAGRFLNARTTKPTLLFSIAAIGFFSVPLLFTTSFFTAVSLLTALGASAALAFNAFQSLVRDQSPAENLAETVGRYTLSWSMGIGLGFLLSGIVRSLNLPLLMAVSCLVACSTLLGLVWFYQPVNRTANATTSTRFAAEECEQRAPFEKRAPSDARYIAIAWSLLLAANFVQRPLSTFLPKFSAQAQNPSWMAGALLAAMLFAQAFSGYAMSRKTHWLYRLKPLVFSQLGIITVLGFLWITSSFIASLLLMACLGVLHGYIYFASVYMASNNAQSARNVGINEMMVGVGNIGGMLWSAGAIRVAGFDDAFFPATIFLSLITFIWQTWWLRKHP